MKVFTISKRNGSRRTIYAPSEEEKAVLRLDLITLAEWAERWDRSNVAHGFRDGRSPVTNAMQHKGYKFTLSMDLADFFDSVKPSHMSTVGIPGSMVTFPECFINGAARQGLPTSPAISNIAASAMDSDICALSTRRGRFDNRFVYTRYADDLTFSFNEERIASVLMQRVPEIVERHGFKLNNAKTKLQCSRAGRRVITGIAVDDALHPTRATKRRLRAMIHQKHMQQAQGLAEWCSLKVPKGYEATIRKQDTPIAKPISNQPKPVSAPAAQAAPEIQVRRRFRLD